MAFFSYVVDRNIECEDMNIHINRETDGIIYVQMVGQLDSVSADDVQAQVLPLAENQARILIDMSAVPYMSSAGLRVLLTLYRHLTDQTKVVLVGLREEVKDVMSMTGFLPFFQHYDTVGQGRQALVS